MTSVADDTVLRLAALVSPAAMSDVMATVLGAGVGAVLATEVLDHKPGRRALVRYETAGTGTVYGKAFPDEGQARRTFDLMQLIAGAVPAPRPLGLAPELGLVLYEPLLGPSLDALAGTDAMDDALAGTARWISTLHSSSVELPRVLDLAHEADNAAGWSATVADAFPGLAESTAQLAAAVVTTVPTDVERAVPIHKDLHYQHVIVGDTIGVVDLDEARMGDRLFDIGHFLVNLALLAHRTGTTADARRRWVTAFVEPCALAAADEARVRWYGAYTCMKVAKQMATGQGPRPRPQGEAGEAQAAWALQHGLELVQS